MSTTTAYGALTLALAQYPVQFGPNPLHCPPRLSEPYPFFLVALEIHPVPVNPHFQSPNNIIHTVCFRIQSGSALFREP